jgi:hypothetical protein
MSLVVVGSTRVECHLEGGYVFFFWWDVEPGSGCFDNRNINVFGSLILADDASSFGADYFEAVGSGDPCIPHGLLYALRERWITHGALVISFSNIFKYDLSFLPSCQ